MTIPFEEELAAKPREYFPFSEYREVVGGYFYPEADYEGGFQRHRIEFAYARRHLWDRPDFQKIKAEIEKYLATQNRTPMWIVLRKGPKMDVPHWFDRQAYLLEVAEHGSPPLPIILFGIAAILASIAGIIIASRTEVLSNVSEAIREAGRGAAGMPKAIIWVAIASIVGSIVGLEKK